MIKNFPNYWSAPYRLLEIEGCCGLVTAWGVLKYFKKRTSSKRLIEACRYTKENGTFMISLAVALREHGLNIKFFSDNDPNPNPIEKLCYKIANPIGVQLNTSISIDALISQINPDSIPIVLYNTDENEGHITPLIGTEKNIIFLPYSHEEKMTKQEFIERWSEYGILKQCIVANLVK